MQNGKRTDTYFVRESRQEQINETEIVRECNFAHIELLAIKHVQENRGRATRKYVKRKTEDAMKKIGSTIVDESRNGSEV
jgi:low affinity Fe/Cu permease